MWTGNLNIRIGVASNHANISFITGEDFKKIVSLHFIQMASQCQII